MFAFEPALSPTCDEWKEYILPMICESRVKSVCFDILRKGEKTLYQEIYDAIYELVEADIECERMSAADEFDCE
jgi:hypothetical protein